MDQERLSEWESSVIDEAIDAAERRLEEELRRARRRAVQLAREQGYHRLALEIDRPERSSTAGPGQLSFFSRDLTLFDDECGADEPDR
jgi:hypothetical protein